MRIPVAVLTLLCASVALAGDDSVPQPPDIPAGVVRPPSPSRPEVTPRAASPAIDEERIAAIVDAAVERAMARRQSAQMAPQAPGPVGGWMPPTASPQGVVATPARAAARIVATTPRRSIGYVPVYGEERQYVQVLVPAGPLKRCAAAVGERLVECGRPRVRTMRVAPAEVQTCTVASPAPAVYGSAQAGTD